MVIHVSVHFALYRYGQRRELCVLLRVGCKHYQILSYFSNRIYEGYFTGMQIRYLFSLSN